MLDGTITDAVEARSLSLNPQVIQWLWVFCLIFNAWCPGINGVHGIHGVLVSIICVLKKSNIKRTFTSIRRAGVPMMMDGQWTVQDLLPGGRGISFIGHVFFYQRISSLLVYWSGGQQSWEMLSLLLIMASFVRRALEEGATTGRGGRGSIFVWASGNGGKS